MDELFTPSRPRRFWVGRIAADGIVLELGEQLTPTEFPWQLLEGAVEFLRVQGM
jgi:hypothetical protein